MSSPLSAPLPWDLVAVDYATDLVPLFTRYADDALGFVGVRAGDRILDVATGPGTLAFRAAARGATVTALDFSPAMVEQLRARSVREGVTLDVHAGDGQALPFDAAGFEAAFSMFGLMFFPDRARGFAELRRVLVPDGRMAVSSWGSLDSTSSLAALFAAIAEATGEAPDPSRGFPLADEDSCRREVEAAGFRDVQVHRVSHGAEIPSLDLFWDNLCRTNAIIVLLRRNLGDAWPALAAKIRDGLARRLGEGTVRLEMPALVTTGVC